MPGFESNSFFVSGLKREKQFWSSSAAFQISIGTTWRLQLALLSMSRLGFEPRAVASGVRSFVLSELAADLDSLDIRDFDKSCIIAEAKV